MSSVRQRRRRGFDAERRLVHLLSKYSGNHVFRIPVSGVGGLPDVFLVNNVEDRVVAFEVKSTTRNKVKVRRYQVEKLYRFLSAFKKYSRREAVIAVWFSGSGKWVFRRVEQLFAEEVVVKEDEESDWMP